MLVNPQSGISPQQNGKPLYKSASNDVGQHDDIPEINSAFYLLELPENIISDAYANAFKNFRKWITGSQEHPTR